MKDLIKVCILTILIIALTALGCFGKSCQKESLANIKEVKQALE